MVRKMLLILMVSALAVASQACSASDLFAVFATPTSPPPPTPLPPSPTVVLPPSSTPITHTPTFTLTPTLIGWNPTDTPTVTGSPAPTGTAEGTPTPEENIIMLPQGSGFQSVLLSQDTIYIGDSCPFPSFTDVRVRVADVERTGLVSFFMRLRNKATGNDSGWDIGTTMAPVSGGLYALTLDANDLHDDDRYRYYTDAWIEFQLVAFDGRVREIGRSEKILDRLTLIECPEPLPSPSE